MKISYCSSTVCSQLATIFIFLSKFDLQGLEQQSFCLLSACLVLTSLALEMCLEKWFQFETATADSYSHIKLQPFPEFTVCPANPYKVDTLRANGISETRDIQFGADWIANDSDIRLRLRKLSILSSNPVRPDQFYESILYKVEELVEDIKVDLEEPFQGEAGIRLSSGNFTICNSSIYTETEYYFNGRCFSFHLPECILNKAILEMSFGFSQKGKLRFPVYLFTKNNLVFSVDVFIHHAGQYFSPDSRARVDVDLRRYKKIAINHEV